MKLYLRNRTVVFWKQCYLCLLNLTIQVPFVFCCLGFCGVFTYCFVFFFHQIRRCLSIHLSMICSSQLLAALLITDAVTPWNKQRIIFYSHIHVNLLIQCTFWVTKSALCHCRLIFHRLCQQAHKRVIHKSTDKPFQNDEREIWHCMTSFSANKALKASNGDNKTAIFLQN